MSFDTTKLAVAIHSLEMSVSHVMFMHSICLLNWIYPCNLVIRYYLNCAYELTLINYRLLQRVSKHPCGHCVRLKAPLRPILFSSLVEPSVEQFN